MSDLRPSEDTDRLELPEMRRLGFFKDLPTGDGFFTEPAADELLPVDHKSEAEEILANRGSVNDPNGLALTHAVLYLAEQQRINNLILLAQTTPPSYEGQRAMGEAIDLLGLQEVNR